MPEVAIIFAQLAHEQNSLYIYVDNDYCSRPILVKSTHGLVLRARAPIAQLAVRAAAVAVRRMGQHL